MADQPTSNNINPFLADDAAQRGSLGGAYDYITSYLKSAAESIPELVGVTPSVDTRSFRQDYPLSGFTSDFLGTAVPYMGWFKALKTVKGLERIEKAATRVGDVVNKPFTTGALQAAVRVAPFEAARVGASQIVGDKSLPDMLGDATLNTALFAGVGGLFHGVAAAGTRDAKLSSIFPDLDLASPLPLQARAMRQAIESGQLTGDNLDRATAALQNTLRDARTEELPASFRYVGDIAHDFSPDSDTAGLTRQLNRLFRLREGTNERTLQVRKFAVGEEKDFPTAEAWREEANASSLPPGFEEHGQFFRHVSFKNYEGMSAAEEANVDKVASAIDRKLTTNMQKVGDNDFLTREADDGMFVLARKIAGTPGEGSVGDKWVLFKTDNPGKFLPDAQRWANGQVAMGKWVPGANLAADGGPVYNAAKNFQSQFPLRNYMSLARSPSGVAAAIAKVLPANVVGEQSETVARLGEAIKEYLAPRIYQFKKSWRANWIVNAAKVTYDQAENLVQELLNGTVKIDPGKNLFFQGLKNDKSPSFGFDPIRGLVNTIPEEQFQKEFGHIWRNAIPVDGLKALQAEGTISPEVAQFAAKLDAIDKWNTANVNKAETAVGRTPTTWKEGHYGLSRQWEGDTRVIVRNDTGQVVALGAGPNRKAALASAQQLVRENPGWRIDGEFSLSQGPIPKDLDPTIRSPSFILERQDVRGFKFDTKPFTRAEFLDAYENALRARMKYQANLTTDDMLGPQMDRLMKEDPAAFRMAQARLHDYAGVQTAFGRWQNKIADQVLGPMLGTNSASRIVQITNTSLFNLQLGALKLAYPVVNALQFVQTVVPEVAFVLGRAPPEALAGRYSFFAAGGTKGPVGGIAALNPIKMMGQSFAEMRKPSAELSEAFERAVNDRVIDPRLVEDYIGASKTRAGDVMKVLRGEESFVGWLRAVSEFLPAETERLSRTHAFTTGYIIARDFLQREGRSLSADQLYSFARQFTENTMYLYSAADKPRIFTTPAGSLLGLFKNWMFHFMSSMGEFTKEGFVHNNWAPLLWQTGGTFALGGLAATPLSFAADQFSRMWTKKSLMENAYEQFGMGADGVMMGLPAALTGVSLYSNVNTPIANPVRDANQLFSIVAWDRAKQIGKTVGAAFDHWQATGDHPGHDRGVREALVKAFAPTTIYRSMGALEPGQITQLGTGYPLVKDVPPMHRLLYAVGFNPTELDRGQAVANEIFEQKAKMTAMVQRLGQAWAAAEGNHDGPQMSDILRQASVWGVDVGQVLKSGMTALEKQRKDVIERAIRPNMIKDYTAAIAAQRGNLE